MDDLEDLIIYIPCKSQLNLGAPGLNVDEDQSVIACGLFNNPLRNIRATKPRIGCYPKANSYFGLNKHI